MRFTMLCVIVWLLLGCQTVDHSRAQSKIERLQPISSVFVDGRHVDVWLPRQYEQYPNKKFPVLYMHDGQNLFNAANANYGVAWEVDDTAQRLIDEGTIEPIIIVGIWSTPKRRLEYFPEKAASYFTPQDAPVVAAVKKHFGDDGTIGYLGDDYLQFIVKELKPTIDARFRTLSDKKNTSISGSSMGGLISMYALAEYPDVFGSAGCISTHWSLLPNNDYMPLSDTIRHYMTDHFPVASSHRLYFDFGTETLDQFYEVHQNKVDKILQTKGYIEGDDWVTKKFPGAAHNEQSWQKRVDLVLVFLFKR